MSTEVAELALVVFIVTLSFGLGVLFGILWSRQVVE